MSKYTPGPWHSIATLRSHEFKIHKCSQRTSESDFTHLATVRARPEGVAVARANALLIAAAPDLLEELKARVKNDEQSAFDDWLRITCPSGDVESVQRQWEESSLYADFLADTEKARGAIAKALGEQQ